jgi:alpha-tubulin suppressor-like RCC1 family protein
MRVHAAFLSALFLGAASACGITLSGGPSDGIGDAGPRPARDASLDASIPTVPGPLRLVRAGGDHTCALYKNGSARCWGRNSDGQLGLGDLRDRAATPGETVASLPALDLGGTVVDVALGAAHTCALLSGGSAKCWGSGENGRLGTENTAQVNGGLAVLPALPVSALQGLSAGDAHACAFDGRGDVRCWGLGSSGQLGYDSGQTVGSKSGDMQALPSVTLAAPARSVVAGRAHTCALLEGAGGTALKCWGSGTRGQLGQGDTAARGNGPGEMGKLGTIDFGVDTGGTRRSPLLVAAGGLHNCAILDDFETVCWGAGDAGALGSGATSDVGAAKRDMLDLRGIDLGAGFVSHSLCAGEAFSCALSEDGRVKCWGKNDRGQLGLGDTGPRGASPGTMGAGLPAMDLGAGNAAAQLTCGRAHACALLASGALKCWGQNDHGQLGLGDAQDRGGAPETSGSNLPAVVLE